MKVSPRKLAVLVLVLGSSAAASFWGQPLLHGNGVAASILACFCLSFGLVALMAGVLAGSPSRLRGTTWREAQASRPHVEAETMHRFGLATLHFGSVLVLLAAALAQDRARPFEHLALFLIGFATAYGFGLFPRIKADIDSGLRSEIRARMIQDGGDPSLLDP